MTAKNKRAILLNCFISILIYCITDRIVLNFSFQGVFDFGLNLKYDDVLVNNINTIYFCYLISGIPTIIYVTYKLIKYLDKHSSNSLSKVLKEFKWEFIISNILLVIIFIFGNIFPNIAYQLFPFLLTVTLTFDAYYTGLFIIKKGLKGKL